jgi:predicted metal-binding membrane protein
MRVLGLVGYLLFAAGYLMMWATEVMAVTILPALTGRSPRFVNDVVVAAGGGTAHGDIGQLQTLFDLTGACYMLGGLLFGIALFRAGILARWAAVLLSVGTVATAALAVLPSAFDRPMAVPEGLALIGLGVSLWRDQRRSAEVGAARGAAERTAEPAAVR